MKKIWKYIKSEYMIFLLFLIGISIIINITKFDIFIQNQFYNADTGWFLKETQPWNFIYHFSFVPALIISILALFLLGRSFIDLKRLKYRKLAAFLVLVMAVGPGLFVNLIFKDNWGRPRPRDIHEFGGKHQYEEVLTIDTESSGKSFPCGHCSMGFFFIAFHFLFRKKNRFLSSAFLFLAILLGGLIGFARIVQGGHFFSDVIWSGAITYFIVAFFYYLFKLDKDLFYIPVNLDRFKKYHSINVLMYVLMSVLSLLVLLATPYNKDKFYTIKEIIPDQYSTIETDISFIKGDVIIGADSILTMDFIGEGFGFPKSRIKNSWKYEHQNSLLKLNFSQYKSGFFTELSQTNKLNIPLDKTGQYTISIESGEVTIFLSSLNNVTLNLSGNYSLESSLEPELDFTGKTLIIGDGERIILNIDIRSGLILLK